MAFLPSAIIVVVSPSQIAVFPVKYTCAGKLMTGAFLLSQLPTDAVGAAILPLLRKVATSVFIGSAILLVLGILCIVGFVLLRKRRMKKAAAVTQTALPTEESSSL